MSESLPSPPQKGNQRGPKPQKPHPDFPLTPHPSGRWCKKIKGKLFYFGPWNDPEGALRRWLALGDAPVAGRQTQKRGRPRKTKKPYPDFPLTPHTGTNRWCKRIRGKLHYFGPLADPEAALNKYKAQADDLHAGRTPQTPADGLTLKDACNAFLNAKRVLVSSGEITYRQWHEYYRTFDLMTAHFGKTRPVAALRPDDFVQLRGVIARGRGVESIGNHVQRVRSLLKWLWENDRIDRPVKVGTEFRRPNKVARRRARQARPQRIFSAEEIRRLLAIATPPMKAMILLGINCGFGNADCAALPMNALDLDKGTVDFPRPKTAIERRCTLWTETIAALKIAIEKRPAPKDKAHAGLVFVTKYGGPWVRYADQRTKALEGKTDDPHGANINAVGLEFGKLLRKLNICREGVAFYSLRHTLESIAGQARDQVAVDRIMGHTDPSMGELYRTWFKDDEENARLRRVTDHVHAWLYAEKAVDKPTETKVN